MQSFILNKITQVIIIYKTGISFGSVYIPVVLQANIIIQNNK